jgi:hypothetical protein
VEDRSRSVIGECRAEGVELGLDQGAAFAQALAVEA